ncbi:MAG: hypothetical protein V4691_09450 [Pseudomonadota bacterium]
MNTTIGSLGSSGVSIGNSVAGQIAENNARQGFGASVGSWSGGASYAAPQQKKSSSDDAQQQGKETKAVASKAQAQEAVKEQSGKWRHFYNQSGNAQRDADASFVAFQALRQKNFFRDADKMSVTGTSGFSARLQTSWNV